MRFSFYTSPSRAAAATARVALLAGLFAAAGTTAFAGASDIDTYGAGGGNGLSPQGLAPSSTPSYGQVIAAPIATDHYLTSFTFYVDGQNNDFKDVAQVFAWNGTDTVGSALFSSGPFTIAEAGDFNAYTVDTSAGGGVNLSSGSQYVVLFTTNGAGNAANNAGRGRFLYRTNNPYAGGNLVFNNTDSTSGNWLNTDPTSPLDFAFKATFGTGPSVITATPEPGAIVTGLSMVGMTGLGLVRGRLRRRK